MMLKKTFKIDNSLYPQEIINNTILVFSDFDIIYHVDKFEIVIEADNPQLVFDEFANYLLSQINEH